MKIVHLCLSAFFIDNYSYQENMITKYHVKHGHEVTVIASLFSFDKNGKGYYQKEPSTHVEPSGVKVIRLAYKEPLKINRTLRHYEGFKECLNNEAPEIIFIHNMAFGDTGIVVDYIKKHPSTLLFADNHADYVNSAKNWSSKHILHPIIWRYYAHKLQPFLKKCYGVTPMRCRFLKEMYHIKPELIEFLPMGVDDEAIPTTRVTVRNAIRTELGIPEDSLVILTGGKIDKLKNTHVLVEALKKMNNKNVHLIICGTLSPEMEYLKSEFESNANIHYLGWCNADRVMNCMVASDLACFPGTHSTLWEQSVGVGLPAIFKRWNEMEHVNVNDNCEFVKGEDVEDLYSVIKKVIEPSYFAAIKEKAAVASKQFLYSEISLNAIQA